MLATEINGNQVVLWSPPNIFLEGEEPPPPNILRLILVDIPYSGVSLPNNTSQVARVYLQTSCQRTAEPVHLSQTG